MRLMKNYFLIAAFAVALVSKAQVSVPEPEFVNSYCILTADDAYDILPKENGHLQQHKNKTKGLLGKIGNVAKIAGSAGVLGELVGVHTGNAAAVLKGARLADTAVGVSQVAGTANILAGAEGMDVVFDGKSSAYVYKHDGKDVRFIIKGENNEQDPMGIYRIVKFQVLGKERRIQWMEFAPSLIRSDEVRKGGYVPFSGHKYGKQSYILTVDAKEIETGEYGIFYMDIITSTMIPVGTFSIK